MENKLCRVCKSTDKKLYKNGNGRFICIDCNTEKCKKYRKTDTGKVSTYTANRKSDVRYPEKYKARWTVKEAIKTGKLVKKDCFCGSTESQAHHEDYSKPLDVIWLCRTHHSEMHHVIS